MDSGGGRVDKGEQWERVEMHNIRYDRYLVNKTPFLGNNTLHF